MIVCSVCNQTKNHTSYGWVLLWFLLFNLFGLIVSLLVIYFINKTNDEEHSQHCSLDGAQSEDLKELNKK